MIFVDEKIFLNDKDLIKRAHEIYLKYELNDTQIKIIRRRPDVVVLKSDSHFILKINKSNRQKVSDIAICYANWQKNNIPAPSVIAYGEIGEYQFMIMEFIPGDDGDNLDVSSKENLDISGQLGQLAAKLHKAEPSKITYLNPSVSNKESWYKYIFGESKRYLDFCLENKYINATQKNIMESHIASIKPIIVCELHGDLGLHNIRVENSRITALLDPDSLMGDPLYDIAYFIQSRRRAYARQNLWDKLDFPLPEVISFFDNYQQHRSSQFSDIELKHIQMYLVLILINKLRYRSWYDPDMELPNIVKLLKLSIKAILKSDENRKLQSG